MAGPDYGEIGFVEYAYGAGEPTLLYPAQYRGERGGVRLIGIAGFRSRIESNSSGRVSFLSFEDGRGRFLEEAGAFIGNVKGAAREHFDQLLAAADELHARWKAGQLNTIASIAKRAVFSSGPIKGIFVPDSEERQRGRKQGKRKRVEEAARPKWEKEKWPRRDAAQADEEEDEDEDGGEQEVQELDTPARGGTGAEDPGQILRKLREAERRYENSEEAQRALTENLMHQVKQTALLKKGAADLQIKFDSTEKEATELKTKVEELKHKLAREQEKVKELKQKLEREQEKLDEQVQLRAQYKRDFENTEMAAAHFKRLLEKKEGEAARLGEKTKDLKVELKTEQARGAELQEKLQSEQSKSADLEKKVAALEKTLSNTCTRPCKFYGKNSALKEEIADLKDKLEDMRSAHGAAVRRAQSAEWRLQEITRITNQQNAAHYPWTFQQPSYWR